MSDLTQKTREICRRYWRVVEYRGRTRVAENCCQGCPLMAACTSGTGTLTNESLAAWVARVNAAAEAVSK